MRKATAALLVAVGASAAPLWPGLAWAYGPPPPVTGGGGGASGLGQQTGASDDLPPLTVTDATPAPGASDTVGLTASSCAPLGPVALSIAYFGPTSTPQQFGPASQTTNSSGGFSITGNVPGAPSAGTYVIFATCSDAAGNTYVYTVTVVIPGTPSGSGVRAAAAGGGAETAAAPSLHAGAAPSGRGAGVTWAPPPDWSTPQLRAQVARAVNASVADSPVATSFGANPVVARSAPTPAPSGAPYRDGLVALVAAVGLGSLLKLNRRHRPVSRLSHRGGLFR